MTDLMTLHQWFSPSFPVGAFAYSHGLEWSIDQGQITSAPDLNLWLQDLIAHGSGRADVILLARAYHSDTAQLTETAKALAASAERRMETDLQGAAFAQTVDAVWKTAGTECPYPVAVGQAAAQLGLALDLTAQLYLQAFVANLISAAVRLVPLGQTDGQRLLASLQPLITHTASEALATPISAIGSQCFAADIAAMKHETQRSRVFRT